MFLKNLINEGVSILSAMYPEREAREMVFAYLESAVGTKRHTYIVDPDFAVSDEQAAHVLGAFRRMASGEPLQYVLGQSWFYGRSFKVTPDVLIPRPETELLCREALMIAAARKGQRMLDLCTGSGCIAWTMALELPGADVVAADISDGALEVASSQDFSDESGRTGARAPEFVKADVLAEQLPDEIKDKGPYDLILSNPPYVMDSEKTLMRVNVLEHEPHLALFVPDDDPLLFYRAVARHAASLLSEKGAGVVEINEALGEETAQVFIDEGFASEVLKDLTGRDRFVRFSRQTWR